MSGIVYSDNPQELKRGDVYYVDIKEGISSKDELLKVYSDELKFPSWFGNNWDALEELLTDLSWINHARVVVSHSDLPKLSSKDLTIFLDILAEHSFSQPLLNPDEIYRTEGKRIKESIEFVFPEKCKNEIQKILKK